MLRTLRHYWPVHLAVLLGSAVATAVLTGALLVGDSVRGSLTDLTLERLGGVESALTADRFFREELAGALPGTAPAILARGSATDPGSGARASRVSILGIDRRFDGVYGAGAALDLSRAEGQIFPSLILNESLRDELDVKVGDSVLLRFGRRDEIPRDTLMGDRDPDALLSSIRLTLKEVIPDRGPGRFGLVPSQQVPLNAFVSLEVLQRALDCQGQVNALFSGLSEPEANALFQAALELEDVGLELELRDGFLELTSREFVLRPEIDQLVGEVLDESGLPLQRIQSYLATNLRHGKRESPYALLAALDPLPGRAWASLTLTDGLPARAPGPGGILLNSWAARDLGAAPGDTIELSYFTVGPREELREEQTELRVEGVVTLQGLGADRTLTPDYPGIRDTRNIADWDPPFPVDLDRIRPKDEAYWDEYGATPKAFVSEATGRELWSTRYGSTTAVRAGLLPDGDPVDPAGAERYFRNLLTVRLSEAAPGLVFLPVKEQGLRAAAGATDFAGLFISFSFFLIVSAALLVGLLFRLGVERRAREIGLLLATGYRISRVRRRLQAEGALLAAPGGLLGVAGGCGYAWLLMAGLRTLWRPAVGSSELFLHVDPVNLIIGWVGSLVVVVVSVMLAVRKLVRLPLPMLLAGSTRLPSGRRGGRAARVLALGGLAGAIVSSSIALATGSVSSPGLAFGTGTALLIAGLAGFALWSRRTGRGIVGSRTGATLAMAARNCSWNPGRSILSVSLIASACFVIVMVASNRSELDEGPSTRESGSGGFSLVAEADVPLYQDLNRPQDRFDLGFSDGDSEKLEGSQVFPFRVLPGDDASCLNLYRPEKPRVLGVTPGFVRRGGFHFKQHLQLPQGQTNPWSLLEQGEDPEVVPAIGDYASVYWILHLGLGQEMTLRNEAGEPFRLRIVGMLEGSVFQSELLVAEDRFLAQFPGTGGDGYFLVDAPAGESQEISRILEQVLVDFGFDVTTTGRKIAGYKVVQNTYLSTFQVLGALGLLLGSAGLGIVLIRNVIERRGELATLRAVGFRRSLLARMVLAENAFLLLAGMGIGTLSALAAVAPRLAGLQLPWLTLGLTLLIVALVGMLSSLAALAGVLRVPMLPALKSE